AVSARTGHGAPARVLHRRAVEAVAGRSLACAPAPHGGGAAPADESEDPGEDRHADLPALGRLGRDGRFFGRLRDLADDLDDVAVRVPDPALPVGAVAAGEDLADALELAVVAELAGMRLDLVERAADELRDRHAVPRPTVEVHHGRLEAVARGQPLVLGREDPVVRGDLRADGMPLAEVLDERLAERRERDRVLDSRHRVADADLDRAEARVQADVPPDVGVVRDAAGLLELADDLRVVGVVAEARRRAAPREGGEDHLPARREAGRLAAPEG